VHNVRSTASFARTRGKAAPHKLHLDPDEIRSFRHRRLTAVPRDDEWDLQESEEEWEGPGDVMYRDYARIQRSTFLMAHMERRVQSVRQEMQRWIQVMERLSIGIDDGDGGGDGGEDFGMDCHDLSLENVFVDKNDHSKIVRLANSLNLMTVILTLLRRASSTGSQRRSDHSGRRPTFPHSSNLVPSHPIYSEMSQTN
jgi:hypothetical protein